ncbi:unnamed protein product [Paramecium sonneborni]|uniref:RING-type domain-containing protein n=1 Tax=Paramecium sonneborni TaxID=65129 RepID=A0A8S1L527_9CILI|nr:unnamed protein product [Paramecium sonneborni]
MNITLNERNSYQIQLHILQFPIDQRYSLLLNISYIKNNTIYQAIDSQAFYSKQTYQNIYINEINKITINVQYKQICNYHDLNVNSFNYSLYIIEKPKPKNQCKFPYFSLNCDQEIAQEQISTLNLTVPKQSWAYLYYILDYNDYTFYLENDESDIGISFILAGIPQQTELPSFDSYFSIIPQLYQYKVDLKRQEKTINYIIVIGIYNFNISQEAKLKMYLEEIKNDQDDLPIWAILVIIGILLLAILIISSIYIQMRRQFKVLSTDIPALNREILDQYMPAKKSIPELINEECCVCLNAYQQDDLIRESICHHIFHDLCLSEWTKKNTSCPVCRQEFSEIEIKRLLTLKFTEGSPFNNHKQKAPFILKYSSLRIIKSPKEIPRNYTEDDTIQQFKQGEISQQENSVQPFQIQ